MSLSGCSKTDSTAALELLQESASVWGPEKIVMIQEAHLLDPNNTEILESLADEALKQWQYKLAEQSYRILETYEWFVDVWKLWRIKSALIQWNELQAQEVVDEYPEAILTSDRMIDIGSLYYEHNYLLLASQWFEEAIETDTTNSKARANLGVVQADLWELAMAKQFMDEAWRLESDNEAIQLNRATLLGDLAFEAREEGLTTAVYVNEALEILDALLEQSPDNQQAELYKAVLLYENWDNDRARQLLEVLIEKYVNLEDALWYLWNVYVNLRETDLARQTFLELLRVNPSHPWAAEELVDLWIE